MSLHTFWARQWLCILALSACESTEPAGENTSSSSSQSRRGLDQSPDHQEISSLDQSSSLDQRRRQDAHWDATSPDLMPRDHRLLPQDLLLVDAALPDALSIADVGHTATRSAKKATIMHLEPV